MQTDTVPIRMTQTRNPDTINPYPAIGDTCVVTRNYLGTRKHDDAPFCLAKLGTSPDMAHETGRVTLGKGAFVSTFDHPEVKDFDDFGCSIVAMAPLDTLPMNRDDYRPMRFVGIPGIVGAFVDPETGKEVEKFDGAIFTRAGMWYKPPTT